MDVTHPKSLGKVPPQVLDLWMLEIWCRQNSPETYYQMKMKNTPVLILWCPKITMGAKHPSPMHRMVYPWFMVYSSTAKVCSTTLYKNTCVKSWYLQTLYCILIRGATTRLHLRQQKPHLSLTAHHNFWPKLPKLPQGAHLAWYTFSHKLLLCKLSLEFGPTLESHFQESWSTFWVFKLDFFILAIFNPPSSSYGLYPLTTLHVYLIMQFLVRHQ